MDTKIKNDGTLSDFRSRFRGKPLTDKQKKIILNPYSFNCKAKRDKRGKKKP